jgi:benzodiazapine receptor
MVSSTTPVTGKTNRSWTHAGLAALVFGGAAALAAVLGSLATSDTVDSAWFESLDKPPWYPPSSAFGIVWTILYVMIAVAGWRAWASGATVRELTPWGVQMALNLAWSLVFFGLQRPGLAIVIIVALAGAIGATIAAFWSRDRIAAWLLVPYLAWVLFASTLNIAIAAMN